MTIYKLCRVKKVIVRSPQPGVVGELIEWDKICKNEKNKCKQQGSGPTIKSLSLQDQSGRLSRFAAGRLWEEECPHWADHQHRGYWWLPYHPISHEFICSTSSLMLAVSSSSIGVGGFCMARVEIGNGI